MSRLQFRRELLNKIMVNIQFQSNKMEVRGGFTIVETLVAVAVLMIAVAGPLVVATKGLNSALASKNQMIASYLAQDTMETVKNIRDNNLVALKSDPNWKNKWLQVFGYSVNGECSSLNNGCDVNGVDKVGASLDRTTCPGGPCRIYYKDDTGYTHKNIGGATVFLRSFYFDAQPENNRRPEVLVHVIVDWKEGTVPYQIHLTSQLVGVVR